MRQHVKSIACWNCLKDHTPSHLISEYCMPKFPNYKSDVFSTDQYEDMVQTLIERRHELSISQEQLAFDIGCSVSLVNKWETYIRVPSGFMFTCWLDALGCQIEIRTKDTE